MELGLDAEDHTFGAAFADFDNDGFQDLLTSSLPVPTLHRNESGLRFSDVGSTGLPPELLDEEHFLGGITVADYDLDGDVDVFIVNTSGADVLLRNESEEMGNFLSVKLRVWGEPATLPGGAGRGSRGGFADPRARGRGCSRKSVRQPPALRSWRPRRGR